jgi:hypothetical protein
MVSTENDRKLPFFGVVGNGTGDSLADPGYKSRVLHLAYRRVTLCTDVFELVMSVKLNLPSQVLELLFEAGFHQVNGTVVNPKLSLVVSEMRLGLGTPSY